jgi:hypothetical protein
VSLVPLPTPAVPQDEYEVRLDELDSRLEQHVHLASLQSVRIERLEAEVRELRQADPSQPRARSWGRHRPAALPEE